MPKLYIELEKLPPGHTVPPAGGPLWLVYACGHRVRALHDSRLTAIDNAAQPTDGVKTVIIEIDTDALFTPDPSAEYPADAVTVVPLEPVAEEDKY